jgi:BirA family biotin operon repressor/biotin-[acetyl-CoA-carboxylase] ligase
VVSAGQLLQFLRLRPGQFVSGEELSSRLGVSRTAVWKHIHLLEESGYRIAAVQHLGYRLLEVPDLLLPEEIRAELATETFGQRAFCFPVTTSTNDRALELAAGGAPEGTLIAAESQTAGRGRHQRTWFSKSHANLLFSVILRPAWTIDQAPLSTLWAAVAVARGIRAETGLPASIKWPNDVLVRGAKVAGILTEMRAQAEMISFIVCGVGINVNAAPSGVLRHRAASLSGLLGRPLARLPLLRRILLEMERLYQIVRQRGTASILEQWQPLSCLQGAPVTVELAGGEVVEGTASGIDENGALLIRMESGVTRRVVSGEVTLAAPSVGQEAGT